MSRLTSAPRWFRTVALALLAYTVLFAVYVLVQPLGDTARLIVGDLVYLGGSVSASALAFLIVQKTRDIAMRRAWALIGSGFVAMTLGDLVYAWEELVQRVMPAPAHLTALFYLAFYVLVFGGLLHYPSGNWSRFGRTKLVLDTWVAVCAAGAFLWYYVIAPIAASHAENVLSKVLELGYPVADLALLWALLRKYFGLPARSQHTARSRPLLWLMAGIALFVAADVNYLLLRSIDGYRTGSPVDILWLLGSVLAAWAALTQREILNGGDEPETSTSESLYALAIDADWRTRRFRVLLPYLAVAASYALMLRQAIGGSLGMRQWGVIVFCGFVPVILLARQMVSVDENADLNRRLIALSKDLELRVAERTAELDRRVLEVTLLNQRVQQSNDELMQIDQLKSEFVANVSHELRTPLTSIMGYTELMLDAPRSLDAPTQQDCLKRIQNNSERLTNLVNDLLEASRVEAGRFQIQPSLFYPASVLSQHVEQAHMRAGAKGLVLRAEIPETLPHVMADAARVGQVMDNLLSNAVKFSRRSGTITVAAYELSVDGATQATAADSALLSLAKVPPGRWLVVTIADQGIGIAPHEQERLYGRFYRTEAALKQGIGGTGLGLHLVKSIIEAHSGHVGVESEVGAGSTFWFALPACP